MSWQNVAIRWLVDLAPLVYNWITRPRCSLCGEDALHKLMTTQCCGEIVCRKCAKEAIQTRWIRKNLFVCPFCGDKYTVD